LGALLLIPAVFVACKAPAPDDGVQVWVTQWPGSVSPEKAEAILLKGADIRCGVGDGGELCFVPAQAINRVEFPDGTVIEAEGIKLHLKRAEGNDAVGVGPYSMEILFRGAVKLTGPFPAKMEAWLGTSPEKGEALPLVSGKQKGPLAIRCPVTLTSLIATGRGMIFGSLAKPGVIPGGPPKKGPPVAGAGATPPPGEGEEKSPPKESEGGPPPEEGTGETPAGEGATPPEEGTGDQPSGEGEKPPEKGSGS
jgi:hypothetical protein